MYKDSVKLILLYAFICKCYIYTISIFCTISLRTNYTRMVSFIWYMKCCITHVWFISCVCSGGDTDKSSFQLQNLHLQFDSYNLIPYITGPEFQSIFSTLLSKFIYFSNWYFLIKLLFHNIILQSHLLRACAKYQHICKKFTQSC